MRRVSSTNSCDRPTPDAGHKLWSVSDPGQHCYAWTESDGIDVLDTTAVGWLAGDGASTMADLDWADAARPYR
jgi:hypothetical protein